MRFGPFHLVLVVLLLVLAPFTIWSLYAEIDQISHAQGQVIASARTQEIQSANDGVIEKIYVKEGSFVPRGGMLALLEKSQAKAAYIQSKSKVAALQATLSRLKAEVYGKTLEFSELVEAYPEYVENQKELYKRRQQAMNDEIAALKESLLLAEEELEMNLPLLESGDIGLSDVIRIKRQIADMKGQIVNKRNKYFQESQTEMTKAEEELSAKEQELADRKVTLERTEIRAPVDAYVKNIILTTRGAKVRPGDVIMELVPAGDRLLVEAKLSPSDLSFVKVGQKAAVKLDAYDYTIHGIFHGTVDYISPDTLIEKTSRGEEFYFRVLIGMEQVQTSKMGMEIAITPGMTTQVDIKTGSRTVFAYLAKPVIKTFSEAMHER
jgi:multidrug resistance efflux pump